ISFTWRVVSLLPSGDNRLCQTASFILKALLFRPRGFYYPQASDLMSLFASDAGNRGRHPKSVPEAAAEAGTRDTPECGSADARGVPSDADSDAPYSGSGISETSGVLESADTE
ncbi:hypothetical protein KIPB_014169, partial [Kipferlia bialata]